MRTCSIEGCDKPARARGWCTKHYQRWKKHGDPTVVYQDMVRSKEDFLRYVEQDKNGCWIWQRGRCNGYGNLLFRGMTMYSHRVAWELFKGPIPKGNHILHNVADGCVSKACVNPKCLRLGDDTDNANDADRAGEAHSMAKVPNNMVEAAIRRVRNGVTQVEVARWLTEVHGLPVHVSSVGYWVRGRNRADCLERVLNA